MTKSKITFSTFLETTVLLACLVLVVTNLSLVAAKQATTIIINDDNWNELLSGEWLVDFHAPWCPACKRLKPEWEKLAGWSNDLDINVASADVTAHPGLSGRFLVSGLPTIYHVKDGLFRIYNGPRKHTELINFIEEQRWKKIEPVSKIWAPDSFQMTLLAYLFRVSMILRDIHSTLTDQYGLPYYVSYAIFALATVLSSAILGILIVFAADYFSPTRHSTNDHKNTTVTNQNKNTVHSGKRPGNKDIDEDDENDDDEDVDVSETEDKKSK